MIEMKLVQIINPPTVLSFCQAEVCNGQGKVRWWLGGQLNFRWGSNLKSQKYSELDIGGRETSQFNPIYTYFETKFE